MVTNTTQPNTELISTPKKRIVTKRKVVKLKQYEN